MSWETLVVERELWMRYAECKGMTSLFFPVRGELVFEQKAVCARCPVAAECLEYALVHEEKHGIWGGTSERERRRLRRRRKAAA